MKLFRYAMLLGVVMAVAGCSEPVADCSQAEVKATLVEALADRADTDEWKSAINEGVKVRNIVTVDSDKANGQYTCEAQLWHPGFEKGELTYDIEYDVQKIEDGEDGNNFQITYNNADFAVFSAKVGQRP